MIPIHELLSRIHWDAEFAAGEFELGYYDRVEDRVIRVPLKELVLHEHDHRFFQLIDAEGACHRIPMHRIREVYKDGRLIWSRPGQPRHT